MQFFKKLRIQRQQKADENWDKRGEKLLWKYQSKPSKTTIFEYFLYQDKTFNKTVRNNQFYYHLI